MILRGPYRSDKYPVSNAKAAIINARIAIAPATTSLLHSNSSDIGLKKTPKVLLLILAIRSSRADSRTITQGFDIGI